MNFLQLWYKKLTPKKNLLILTIAIITLTLPLILLQLKKQQETRSRAEGEPVSFTLTPQTVTKPVGETFDAQLFLNAAGNTVSAIDFTLSFGNDSLEMVSFTPTDAFNTQLKNIPNNGNGTLIYTAGDTAGKPAVGNVNLGTIRFKTKSPGVNTLSLQKAKVTPSGKAGLIPTNTTTIASYTVSQTTDVSPTQNPQVPTETPIVVPSPSPTTIQQPTEAPSPTDMPTPTLAQIPTPVPGGARISMSLTLSGLIEGIGGNPNPKAKQKRVKVCAYQLTADPTQDVQCSRGKKAEGLVQLSDVSKKFDAATFDLGIVPEGDYEIYVKIDKYLRKRIPGIKHLKPDTTTSTQQVQLKSGDITGDNVIDLEDYNAYASCFDKRSTTSSCLYRDTVDLNDDGKVDTTIDFSDYKILMQNYATREGD